jgi:hypothetical protein
MPRGARPALAQSGDYSSLTPQQRVSYESQVDDILATGRYDNLEFDAIPGLLIVMKDRKRKAVQRGDYAGSQAAQNAIARLAGIQEQRRTGRVKSAKLSELEGQMQQAQAQLRAAIERWNKRIEAFNVEQARACAELERRQVDRLSDFDASISETLPPSYCKLTPQLLDMREQERQLVLTKRYDEATALKRTCDNMEREEAERQKTRYRAEIVAKRRQLIADQSQIIDCFKARWTRALEKLEAERDRDLAMQQKFVDTVKLKIRMTEEGTVF